MSFSVDALYMRKTEELVTIVMKCSMTAGLSQKILCHYDTSLYKPDVASVFNVALIYVRGDCCNNLVFVTCKLFYSRTLCHFVTCFLPCKNTLSGQLCPKRKLHFLKNKCFLGKQCVSLNAINETILSVCTCQLFNPTLCYDMHSYFYNCDHSIDMFTLENM